MNETYFSHQPFARSGIDFNNGYRYLVIIK